MYCASKFGQVRLTRALDHELREHGIRCTKFCPGGVATDFALEEGGGTAEEVAEIVVFVLERPRHLRILETALRPMTEQSAGLTGANGAHGIPTLEHRGGALR